MLACGRGSLAFRCAALLGAPAVITAAGLFLFLTLSGGTGRVLARILCLGLFAAGLLIGKGFFCGVLERLSAASAAGGAGFFVGWSTRALVGVRGGRGRLFLCGSVVGLL